MSAQQFLDNALGRIGDVFFGADYDDVVTKPTKPSNKPNPYSAKPRSGNFSGQSRNVFETIKEKVKSMPGSQPAKPNPYAAKPTGQLTQGNAGSLLGLASMTTTGAVTAPLILGGSEDASRKWSRLGYSSPEAYQTAISQNANRERPNTSNAVPSPTNSKPNNAAEINARLKQQAAERATALSQTKGNYDHSSGSYVGQDVAFVPDSVIDSSNSGRDDSRKIPGGGTQTGTNMSRSFNDLLATTNTSGYQPYSSNQLPTTASNPFEGTAPKTNSFDVAAPGISGATYDNYGAAGGVAAASSTDKSEFTPMSGKESRIEGGSDRKAGGSLADALNDKAGISSYMSKFSGGDQERAANRAFLDTEGSMEALRAKEAVNGVVYAQQQHYVAGENADSPAVKITRDNARDISNGKSKAQDFLAKKTADTVAATKQAPTVLEDGAKDGAFKQDKPMFSGSTPAIEGAVEFDNNNDKTHPTFGNNGGYKSGFKKIDTTMTNPFG